MPLSPMDEYLAHQTPETFDHVYTSDKNFYDRYYFNMHACSDELFLVTGIGQYPNLGVTDCFASISHGDTMYVVRASRELGSDRLDMSIGPYGVEVVEGLKTLHLWLEPNEWGIEFDLTFEGAVPALEEPKTFIRSFERVTQDVSRYAQVGNYSGTLKVAGQTYQVTPDRWKGARDHSWGVRPVGDPEAPGIRAKAAGAAGGFFHTWLPMQFDDYMLKVFIQEDGEGNRIIEESVKIWNFGSDRPEEPMGRPSHDFTFVPGTRRLASAVTTLDHPSGTPVQVKSTALRTVFLAGGSGYRPEPDWVHGKWQGPDLVVQGLTYDLSDPEVLESIAGLHETLCRFDLDTGEVGYGMQEHAISGVYKPYGFMTPDAVAP